MPPEVRVNIESVVRGLGLPHDIGVVVVDLLPEHLEGHPRFRELLEKGVWSCMQGRSDLS